MRALRLTLWLGAFMLAAFIVLSPFVAGIQETSSQIQAGTSAKSAKLGEAQGGAEGLRGASAEFPEGKAVARIIRNRNQLLATAGALVVFAFGHALWQTRKNRRLAEARRRPPSTKKAAPASHRDLHEAEYLRASNGPVAPTLTLTDDELNQLASINSVGLLAGLAATSAAPSQLPARFVVAPPASTVQPTPAAQPTRPPTRPAPTGYQVMAQRWHPTASSAPAPVPPTRRPATPPNVAPVRPPNRR